MLKPIKVAFIRLTAMGDIIHSASILPLLHQQLSQTHNPTFHWYVDSSFKEILESSPFVDKLIAIPLKQSIQQKSFKNLYLIYKTLKSESYDIVIDLQGLIKSAIVGKILHSKKYVGFDFKSAKESLAALFYTQKIHIPYHEHILLRNATLAFNALNLPTPNLQTLFNPKPFLSFNPALTPQLPKNSKNILFVLETSKPNKTYPKALFLELAKLFNAIGISPILLTHKTTINDSSLHFYHFTNLSLNAIKALLAQMDLIIGGDTGITHLAWALQKPSITLFGATPPKRFHLQTSINLYLVATPDNTDKKSYDKKNFSIQTIPPQEIFNLAKSLLERKI